MVLQEIQKILEKEEFTCSLFSASEEIPFDRLMIFLGLDAQKRERMLEELKEEGISLSEDQLSHIFSPVGLDIGAESPEEIALSILSEIKAVLAKRETTTSLKNNPETIHSRTSIKIGEEKILFNQ